ncbi:hypothetical protein B0J14DRAFT_608609 [Halenospora varia]|nr:hypothetical protein B0J14DRAFT_608609 [Halenospora varia]
MFNDIGLSSVLTVVFFLTTLYSIIPDLQSFSRSFSSFPRLIMEMATLDHAIHHDSLRFRLPSRHQSKHVLTMILKFW